MNLKDWQKQVLADAREHPTESYAAYARWAGVSTSALLKARKSIPEFQAAIDAARAGEIANTAGDIEQRLRQDFGFEITNEDTPSGIFPRVLEHVCAFMEGGYRMGILGGGIGSGKTTTANLCLALYLQDLLSQDDPHAALGMDPRSPLIVVFQNRSKSLSAANAYAKFRSIWERSPWAALNAPFDRRTISCMKFERHAIEVWPCGPGDGQILGMDPAAGLLDEVNFYSHVERSKRAVGESRTYDEAQETFDGITRRMKSRFVENAGPLIVASSRRYKGEFLERLENEYRDDPRCYRFNETSWSIAPHKYAGQKFFSVFIGDQVRAPRVLPDDELVHPADRSLVVQIPETYRRSFKSNLRKSLQDIAGIPLNRIGSYFRSPEDLERAAVLGNTLVRASETVGNAYSLAPKEHSFEVPNPKSPRCIHADLSLSGDSSAICIAHISHFDTEGRPCFQVDGLARVHPPQHGQIDLNAFFELIRYWQQCVEIHSFSADQFQSADLLQRVAKLGIRTGRLSVDRTEMDNPAAAYEVLRVATVENRIRMPKDDFLVSELLALEFDAKANKVDHAPNGTKDASDALAGAIYSLSKLSPWTLVDKVPNAGYAAAVASPKLGGQVSGWGRVSEMDLIRVARGMPFRH